MKIMKPIMSNQIGKVYNVVVPYFERKSNRTLVKARPCMILDVPKNNDKEYVILPISSSLDKKYYDEHFDTLICKKDYQKIKLLKDSYIRSHKQTIAYESNIDFKHCLGDIKSDYPELFNIILHKYITWMTFVFMVALGLFPHVV